MDVEGRLDGSREALTLSAVWEIVSRRRRLLLALALLGAIVGADATLVAPPMYQSTSKVLLEGTREKGALATEAQIASSLVVLNRAATVLAWGGVSGTDLKSAVTSDVGDGSVIEISGRATNPVKAQQLTAQVTQQYMKFTTEISASAAMAISDVLNKRQASLQAGVDDLNRQIAALQSSTNSVELQRLIAARGKVLDELGSVDKRNADAESQASSTIGTVRIIEPPRWPEAAQSPTRLQLIAGGSVAAVLLGMLALLVMRFRDDRLRYGADISAAAGAPILATVLPPPIPARVDEPTDTEQPTFLKQRGHRLAEFFGATPLPVSRRPELEYLRYTRAVTRMPRPPVAPARLILMVPEADASAIEAAAWLTVALSTARPVRVVSGNERAIAAVRACSAGVGAAQLEIGPRPQPAPHAVQLEIVPVLRENPILSDSPPGSRSFLVLASATATAWQLNGIGDAAADAGCRLTGVLLVSHTTQKELPPFGFEQRPTPDPIDRTDDTHRASYADV